MISFFTFISLLRYDKDFLHTLYFSVGFFKSFAFLFSFSVKFCLGCNLKGVIDTRAWKAWGA